MNRKQKLLSIGLITATLCTGVVVTMTSTNKDFLKVLSSEKYYNFTLNEGNAPVVNGETATLDVTDYIQLTYTGANMTTGADQHITMTGGGSVTTSKQIRGINQISVTASGHTAGKLVCYVGYTLEDVQAKKYAYLINVDTATEIDTTCNYFSIVGSVTYTLKSVNVSYECASDLSMPEAPTGKDKVVASFGGPTKQVVNNADGSGTIKDAQTHVTNADGLPYNYKYLTYSVDLKFNSQLLAATGDYNVGLQLQKQNNANGSVSKAIQFSITNFSTGAWAVKVNGSSKVTGNLADKGITLNATDYFTFKAVISYKDASNTTLKCYINDVLLTTNTRGPLGADIYYAGIRFSSGNFGLLSYKNISITGSNTHE